MLDEENLLKLIIVEEEDDYEGEDDEEEEELVREEKEEDRHDKMEKPDERSIEIGEIQEEEGTSGGYFDLLPVSDSDLMGYSCAGEVCYLLLQYF